MVSEYRKARAIMADVAVEGATEGVWHNLFLEVDKVALHQHIFLSYLADLDLRPRIYIQSSKLDPTLYTV